MPIGPKGEKRPADVIGNAVMRIATGEIEDAPYTRNLTAVARGRIGGKIGVKARASHFSEEQRSHSAAKGAKARCKKADDAD
jgi:hypothetical protein